MLLIHHKVSIGISQPLKLSKRYGNISLTLRNRLYGPVKRQGGKSRHRSRAQLL